MSEIARIASNPLSLLQANPATVGKAAARFADVLTNTLEQQAGQATANSPLRVGNTPNTAAAAEGGRYTGFSGFGGGGEVAQLSQSVAKSISNRLEQVRTADQQADQAVQTLLSGGDIELHNVVMAAERAKLELQLTMQLRNKLLEAYQEIMRMPV